MFILFLIRTTKTTMKNYKFWVGIGCLLTYFSMPTETFAKYTADFLTLGIGARAVAMGGSATATTDDAFAIYWNPAALGQQRHHQLGLMHATLNGLAAHNFIGYSHPLKKSGAFSIAWLRVGVDDIPITALPVTSRPVGPTNRPKVIGTTSHTQNAAVLAGGWHLLSLSQFSFRVGGALKLLYVDSYRNTNALGGGGDFGLLITAEKPAVSLGVQVADVLSTKLYWNTPPAGEGDAPYTETLAPHVKIGIASTHRLPPMNSRLTLACDVFTQHWPELHAGAEYMLFDVIALRIGVEGQNGTTRLMRLTTGVGVHLRFVTGAAAVLDYAFANHPELGGSHRMSFQIGF